MICVALQCKHRSLKALATVGHSDARRGEKIRISLGINSVSVEKNKSSHVAEFNRDAELNFWHRLSSVPLFSRGKPGFSITNMFPVAFLLPLSEF